MSGHGSYAAAKSGPGSEITDEKLYPQFFIARPRRACHREVRMKYYYTTEVRDHEGRRRSFNALTRRTFHFDFREWYASGHWGESYIPHVLLDGERVLSNVSVNLMRFDDCGRERNYIQLGTVMTDPDFRGQGLNREIMERVLEEYAGRADGIYLFGNDSAVDYYPKFGFVPVKEYESWMPCRENGAEPYGLKKLDPDRPEHRRRLCGLMEEYEIREDARNENDGLYLSDNMGLYWFWIAAEYGKQICYIPETGNCAVLSYNGKKLYITQIFGKQKLDLFRLAKSFGEDVEEVVLEYTPADREAFQTREYREEDCTLFVLGQELLRTEQEKMRFPAMSHA